MKIKINEFETYEIHYDDKKEMSKTEFIIYVERLENIRKLLSKSQVLEEEQEYTTYPKKRKEYTKRRRIGLNSNWTDSREKVIYLMSVFYSGDKQLRNEICKKIKRLPDDVQKGFYGLKKRYDIQSKEVGLKRWLVKHESRKLTDVRIPNFKIKVVNLENEKNDWSKELVEEDFDDKYHLGIIHYDIDGKYGCNQTVTSSERKLSKDWTKINCDNCKRKFENQIENDSTSDTLEKEEETN